MLIILEGLIIDVYVIVYKPIFSFQKDSDRVVGAVAGRGAVESLYVTYVKGYLPTKQPGVPYTKLEMDKAYTDFFNDQKNELAQALLKELPSKYYENS